MTRHSKLFGKHGYSAKSSLRKKIAAETAKLIVEEGVTDYSAAKAKAAKMLGGFAKTALPEDREIDAAVHERLLIFHSQSQPQELQLLREIAAEVMRGMRQFSPLVRGPVLTGTATHFSPIELELVVEDEKVFDFFLLNAGIAYRIVSNARVQAPERKKHYEFTFKNCQIIAMAFDSSVERASFHKKEGRETKRADLAVVEGLLGQSVTTP